MAKKPSNYKITLKIAGIKYKQEGETIEDALAKFDIGWWLIKGKCIVNITKGMKKHEHIFTPRIVRRILINKTLRMIWGQKLTYLLK